MGEFIEVFPNNKYFFLWVGSCQAEIEYHIYCELSTDAVENGQPIKFSPYTASLQQDQPLKTSLREVTGLALQVESLSRVGNKSSVCKIYYNGRLIDGYMTMQLQVKGLEAKHVPYNILTVLEENDTFLQKALLYKEDKLLEDEDITFIHDFFGCSLRIIETKALVLFGYNFSVVFHT